jgi:dTDP-4-amino-4,6-dideoxygalactose transaminase
MARAVIGSPADPGEVFEASFGRRCVGSRPVVIAPSARVALYWLLAALGVGDKDEVVTQAFNFPAVPAAVVATGARPRFVDLATDSFEGDWSRIEEHLSDRTRAVIVTHLYGNPADLGPVVELCAARGLYLIEDCAQGIGATIARKPVGTWGAGAIFSLGGTKNLTLLGGGAVAAEDPDLTRRLQEMAADHPSLGLAAATRLAIKAAVMATATHPLVFTAAVLPLLRFFEARGVDLVHRVMEEPATLLTGIECAARPSRHMAAVGLAQLGRVEAINRARVRNGWYLRARLGGSGLHELVVPPMREGSVFMSFPVLHPRRRRLAAELRARGVDTDFGFMADCASLEVFAGAAAECPNAARTEREILHLPVYPSLGKRRLDRIAGAVRAAVAAV